MATTPESYKVTEHIINDDLLSKFQKLQDDHVGLQQILRNRVLPQQENADELISEAISKCRFVFSKKILEVRTEMNEMTRRIDDFADSVEKELNELETMVESLRAEQKRMKSSLPSEVLPSLLSLNRKSSTPKAVNSPKIIRKKENLPPSLGLPRIEVLQKKPETSKKDLLQNLPRNSENEKNLPKSPLDSGKNIKEEPQECGSPKSSFKEDSGMEKKIFEEETNLSPCEQKSMNVGERTKRRPSLAEALWEKMTSPSVVRPLGPPEPKKSDLTSPIPTEINLKSSPEVGNQLAANVTSRNKRNYESEDTEPPNKKSRESQASNNSSLDLFQSDDEEEDGKVEKITTEAFVKPQSSDLLMTKVFPQTAKSPALSLIPEEYTTPSMGMTPALPRRQGRSSRPRVSGKSESKSRSASPFSEDNSEVSDADSTGGRRVRRAAAQIKSFKEPSLVTKLRQPKKKKK